MGHRQLIPSYCPQVEKKPFGAGVSVRLLVATRFDKAVHMCYMHSLTKEFSTFKMQGPRRFVYVLSGFYASVVRCG